MPPVPVQALLLPLAVLAAGPVGAESGLRVERLTGWAFGHPATLEARSPDTTRLRAHLEGALAEIARVELQLRSLEARLLAAAGQPAPVQLAELELLARALGACRWSEGVVSPVAGRLYDLVGLRQPVERWPAGELLQEAGRLAPCTALELDPKARAAKLQPGTRLELFPFEAGWAVDRAASFLRAAEVGDFLIQLGAVARAEGPGPDGRGWRFEVPTRPGAPGLDPLLLQSRSIAILQREDPPLLAPGERRPPYLDLRSGASAAGILLVAVVDQDATDARAVAHAMFALGPTRGQLLLGNLRPSPAVAWLLGSGEGEPLRVETGWSRVARP